MPANLSPINPSSYLGVLAPTPANTVVELRDPTQNDYRQFNLGDYWLNKNNSKLFVLVFLGSKVISGQQARYGLWAELTSGGKGTVQTLTTNTGGAVGPDGIGNINVVGDGVTITGVGNPATNTITFSLIGGLPAVETLTGNSGGAVGPDGADNINVVGDGTTITIAGNPGTHTLTASVIGTGVLSTLTGDDAVPVTPLAGNIDVFGTPFSGSTVRFEGSTPHTLNLQVTDSNDNILIGFGAGNGAITGTNNVGTGLTVGHALTTGHDNSMYGFEAGLVIDAGILNNLFGSGAGSKITSGNENIAISSALPNLTTGSNNIAIGTNAGSALTTENDCVLVYNPGIVGTSGLIAINIPNVSSFIHNYGTNNTFVGGSAGNFTLNSSFSTGLGSNVLNALTTGDFNTAAGNSSQTSVTTGASNSSLGDSSLAALTSGNNNVVAGQGSMVAATSSSGCTVVGQGSATNLLTGSNNLILGQGAGNSLTGAESNVLLFGSATGVTGVSSMVQGSIPGDLDFMLIYGTDNTFFGRAAGNVTVLTGANNTGIGRTSLNVLQSGNANTCIGQNSGPNLTTGSNNTFIGAGAGTNATTCTSNVMIGQTALGTGIATGIENVGIGFNAANRLTSATNNSLIGNSAGAWITTGSFNTCNGDTALATGLGGLTTGSYNVAFGHNVGSNYTAAESSNILINHPGVNGENNTMRIGMSGGGNQQINRAFIAGIRGITTGVADALPVLVDSADQLGTISSSARYKENIHDLNWQSEIVYKLRPVAFNYKKDESKSPVWGLIAEEVAEVFPRLAVYGKDGEPESVKYHELPVLLLNEIQRLRRRIEVLESKIS